MIIRLLLTLALLLPGAFGLAQDAPRKPIIGINMSVSQREGSESTSLSVPGAFVDVVVAAGGTPVLLPAVVSDEHVAQYCDLVDGFIFVGGPDIDPARYGEEPHSTHNPIHQRREDFDFMLMKNALETRKPVLAVCLGSQEFNVLQGGSLIQDIPSQTDSQVDHRPRGGGSVHAHEVAVTPGTKLHALLGVDKLNVNSIHHQACKQPGAGLVVAARAPDGIVEAVERPDLPFAIGVQWHPEYLTAETPHRNLFSGLVDEARRQRETSEEKIAGAK